MEKQIMDNNSQRPVVRDPEMEAHLRKHFRVSFGLFLIFFVYYMGAAVIQTQALQTVASKLYFGMPLGLFLSIGVFPVSGALIAVYFYLWR